MPSSSSSGLRWLARYASSKSAKSLPEAGRFKPSPKSSRPFPAEPGPTAHTTSRSSKPRLLFSHNLYLFRESWRDFKDSFRPEFRRKVWQAWWILPWIPIAVVFDKHVFTVMRIKGPSMTPTLNKDYKEDEPNTDDRVLVNMWDTGKSVKRGDIVASRSPQDPEKIVIKRVAAVQGDQVRPLPPHPEEPMIIQWGQVWVEGDNEDKSKSKDSNWYGPIPRGLIVGTVVAIVWPLNHIGGLSLNTGKDNTRVIKRVVALQSPDAAKAEREAYWMREKAKLERQHSEGGNSHPRDGEAERMTIREIETA